MRPKSLTCRPAESRFIDCQAWRYVARTKFQMLLEVFARKQRRLQFITCTLTCPTTVEVQERPRAADSLLYLARGYAVNSFNRF